MENNLNLKNKKFSSEGNLQDLLKQELTFKGGSSVINNNNNNGIIFENDIYSNSSGSTSDVEKIIDCLIHGECKIEFVCDDCEDKPICKLCLSGYHKGHRVSILDEEKTKAIVSGLKERNNILSTLLPIKEFNDNIFELAKKQLEASENKKEKCKQSISNEFKKLYEMFKEIENAKLEEIEEHQKSNLDLFNKIQSNYHQHQNTIVPIEETIRQSKKDNVDLDGLEIIKFNHQINELLKNQLEFTNFSKISVDSNQYIIDTILDSLKKLIIIKESKFNNDLNNSTNSNNSLKNSNNQLFNKK